MFGLLFLFKAWGEASGNIETQHGFFLWYTAGWIPSKVSIHESSSVHVSEASLLSLSCGSLKCCSWGTGNPINSISGKFKCCHEEGELLVPSLPACTDLFDRMQPTLSYCTVPEGPRHANDQYQRREEGYRKGGQQGKRRGKRVYHSAVSRLLYALGQENFKGPSPGQEACPSPVNIKLLGHSLGSCRNRIQQSSLNCVCSLDCASEYSVVRRGSLADNSICKGFPRGRKSESLCSSML